MSAFPITSPTYPYQISRFEVTNAQYAVFLNAVAAEDANGLYSTSMASGFGGITRGGSSGGFSYSAIAGREDKPVDYVSFWDALRFANWLHNGQPLGVQDDTTTEDGAYTLTIPGAANRNSEAVVFLTSEDEWYKAAYYDGASGYFDFPAGSDVAPACATPGATANTANCDNAVADLSDVGGYTGAASPSGTFDQAGNVQEWTEAILGANRVLRGAGSFNVSGALSSASTQSQGLPAVEIANAGFRVARTIPPGVPSMSPLGRALLASLLGLACWRKLS